jgi:hypothetical protein
MVTTSQLSSWTLFLVIDQNDLSLFTLCLYARRIRAECAVSKLLASFCGIMLLLIMFHYLNLFGCFLLQIYVYKQMIDFRKMLY